MTIRQPARPAAPPSTYPMFQSPLERRIVCNGLRLYRFCTFAHCRRAQRCHGDPRRCLATRSTVAPPEARTVMEAILRAGRYENAEPGSGAEWLHETYRREMMVFQSWVARLDARRKGRAPTLSSPASGGG